MKWRLGSKAQVPIGLLWQRMRERIHLIERTSSEEARSATKRSWLGSIQRRTANTSDVWLSVELHSHLPIRATLMEDLAQAPNMHNAIPATDIVSHAFDNTSNYDLDKPVGHTSAA